MSKYYSVKQVRGLVALLLLAVWLPASMHCSLEDAGWLPKDESCASAPSGHGRDDGCEFENGGVHFQAAKVIIPSFSFTFVVLSYIAPEIPARSLFFAFESEFPFELAQCWQFSFRAALPVRAPSLFS